MSIDKAALGLLLLIAVVIIVADYLRKTRHGEDYARPRRTKKKAEILEKIMGATTPDELILIEKQITEGSVLHELSQMRRDMISSNQANRVWNDIPDLLNIARRAPKGMPTRRKILERILSLKQ